MLAYVYISAGYLTLVQHPTSKLLPQCKWQTGLLPHTTDKGGEMAQSVNVIGVIHP